MLSHNVSKKRHYETTWQVTIKEKKKKDHCDGHISYLNLLILTTLTQTLSAYPQFKVNQMRNAIYQLTFGNVLFVKILSVCQLQELKVGRTICFY